MKYLKAFMAGILLPSVVLPLGLYLNTLLGNRELLNVLFIHLIPLMWGIWNALAIATRRYFFPKQETLRLLLVGGLLGLLIALIGVCWLDLPTLVGLKGFYRYFPLMIAPIAYAILWLYVVKPLNKVLGIKNS